ncbi:MAG: WG repeat-containing protein, partial [Trichodesmium sp.]
GKRVIQPEYDFAGNFSEGLAEVRIDDKYGYINAANEMVIEPEFDNAFAFSNGIAEAWVDDKKGYIDQIGRSVWNLSN